MKVSHIANAPPVSAVVAWMKIRAPKGVLATRSWPGKETTAFLKFDISNSASIAFFGRSLRLTLAAQAH
ncbi:hypothetical protein RLEG3_23535 [Rhizobium leguminosarum bv. trifolii WSM1689]|nr:hypothetical protein RLEG3_23535 [Rhizobium leguminosarum bv. trifolii WSM1689]